MSDYFPIKKKSTYFETPAYDLVIFKTIINMYVYIGISSSFNSSIGLFGKALDLLVRYHWSFALSPQCPLFIRDIKKQCIAVHSPWGLEEISIKDRQSFPALYQTDFGNSFFKWKLITLKSVYYVYLLKHLFYNL